MISHPIASEHSLKCILMEVSVLEGPKSPCSWRPLQSGEFMTSKFLFRIFALLFEQLVKAIIANRHLPYRLFGSRSRSVVF